MATTPRSRRPSARAIPGAIAALAGQAELARAIGIPEFSSALSRRLGIARAWQLFMERYPVVLLPVSAELPFPDDLDLQGPRGLCSACGGPRCR